MKDKNNRFITILLAFTIVALIATGVFLVYKVSYEGKNPVEGVQDTETNDNSLADILKNTKDLSIFYNLTLSSEQLNFLDVNEFTVFVPNNDLMLTLGEDNIEQLENPGNIRILIDYIRSFAVKKLVYEEDLKTNVKLESLDKGKISIKEVDGIKVVSIGKFEGIVSSEMNTANGVMYVLSPKES